MGNNTAVYQVIWLLLYYLYFLMLDIRVQNIRNQKLMIETSKFGEKVISRLSEWP